MYFWASQVLLIGGVLGKVRDRTGSREKGCKHREGMSGWSKMVEPRPPPFPAKTRQFYHSLN